MVQRKHKDGQRPRISVSLDPDDYEWVQGFTGSSDSYKVARLIHAARLAGVTMDDATSGGVLEGFRDWLKSSRKRTKLAQDLQALLSEYLQVR